MNLWQRLFGPQPPANGDPPIEKDGEVDEALRDHHATSRELTDAVKASSDRYFPIADYVRGKDDDAR